MGAVSTTNRGDGVMGEEKQNQIPCETCEHMDIGSQSCGATQHRIESGFAMIAHSKKCGSYTEIKAEKP